MGSLTSIEKRKLYGGDKTILYEKLGLIDETDIEKYRKKFGIKKGVDMDKIDVDEAIEKKASEGNYKKKGYI
jgi:hypothetical protein